MRNLLFALSATALMSIAFEYGMAGNTDDSLSLVRRQQQDPKTPLYLDEPACDSYQCSVKFHPGDTATAHWLNAPPGDVELDLLSNASSVVFTKIAIVPGVSTTCKAEKGSTCGQFKWIVPSAWENGNYTLRALSSNDPSILSYTDVILVIKNDTKSNDAPHEAPIYFKALDPVATDVKQPKVVGAAPGATEGDGGLGAANVTAATTFAGSNNKTLTPTSSTAKNGTKTSTSNAGNVVHPGAAFTAWTVLLPTTIAITTGFFAFVL